jgi:hypothetical protein
LADQAGHERRGEAQAEAVVSPDESEASLRHSLLAAA